MDVNLKGPWLCAKYAFPSSNGAAGYHQHHLRIRTLRRGQRRRECLRCEQAGPADDLFVGGRIRAHGIRVNAIAPGVIVTERLGGQVFVSSEVGRHEMERTPLRRLGVPADVGRVAVFLASDDASYINGTTITLDGGSMAVW